MTRLDGHLVPGAAVDIARSGKAVVRGFHLLLALLFVGCGGKNLPERDYCLDSRERAWTVLKLALGTGEETALRVAAVESLGEMNEPQARRWLQQALYDPEAEVRLRAAMEIAVLPSGEFSMEWSFWLGDEEPAVRAAALLALIIRGESEYCPVLRQRLNEGDIPLQGRWSAVWMAELHRCFDREGLRELLSRVSATDGLDVGSPPEATALRRALLKSGDEWTRRELEQRVVTLGEMRNPGPDDRGQLAEAVRLLGESPDPVVRYALERQWQAQPDMSIRILAGRSLARLGYPVDGRRLHEWVEDEIAKDRSETASETWVQACWLLGELNDTGALPLLREILERQEDDDVRLAAAGAILRLTFSMVEPAGIPPGDKQ